MFTAEQLDLIDASVLCWLATADDGGAPSVSPKEVFALRDGRVLIANVASPNSARNVKANARVCVAFLDVFRQKGVKVYGSAELINKADDRFADLAPPLEVIAGDAFPFASLFLITPTSVKPIIAPRYRLYPETTEANQIASAMVTYGVRPADA